MKIFDEKLALKAMIKLIHDPKSLSKNNYICAVIGFLFSLGLMMFLIFFSKNTINISGHFLSFVAGGLLFWSWVKVTEVYGLKFLLKYMDLQKMESQIIAFGDDGKTTGDEPYPCWKFLLNMVIWAGIAIVTLSAINYLKSI